MERGKTEQKSPELDPNRITPARSERNSIAVVLGTLFLLLTFEIWWSRRLMPPVTIERAPEHLLDYRLDLNEATLVELLHLPDIGPELAERIVNDRDEHGSFSKLEDLQRVPGIGPKTLESIRPYLRWPGMRDSPSVHGKESSLP